MICRRTVLVVLLLVVGGIRGSAGETDRKRDEGMTVKKERRILYNHDGCSGLFLKAGSLIHHISVSGTASYPCDFARFAVYGDRIEVEMLQVSEELVAPATNMHGPPRYKEGFTDGRHKTPEAYVGGTPGERRFTIKLPAGKRPSAE